MRELKARRWKSLQRLNYALFALVVLHAYFYGALLQLRMRSPLALLLVVTIMAVVLGQAVGVWLWRRRYSRAMAQPA
jgi:DMSO/TMAO reductase YedYZ heme-binding membrane subunit